MMYVSQLPEAEQKQILAKIKAVLFAEGHTAKDIREALADAQDSKLSDVSEVLQKYEELEEE